MKQLGGLDASFLYLESPQSPMHVAGLTLYELPKGFRGSFHKHFTAFFKSRVHMIPIFNMKLAKSMFQMDHPGWVDAGELDFEYHIQSVKLDKPGSFEQLEQMVADLHSVPLDRSRPLWQFTVIEGLQDKQAALYSKVHHAAVDGGAGMVITKALYDVTETPREVEPPAPKEPARKPTQAERAILGLHDLAANAMRQQLKMMEAAPKIAGQMADLMGPVLAGKVGLPQILAPKTPFNTTIDAKRSYAARSVSLADVKAIGKATGTKLNDVVMAICSGALRTYLMEKQVLPDASLVAFVPISLREMGNSDINNQVFGMSCPLATNYGNPLKRLRKIAQESGASKVLASGGKDLALSDYTLLGAPMLLPGLAQLYGLSRLADVIPQVVNVTISNTQGPPFPLFCAGAKVTALYPVSIPAHGVALNLTVQSYLDHMDFGLTADHKAVPDIDHLGDLLVNSFEELKSAAAKAH
jgi:WS/DGAT/MGAT family acyltransferase